MSSASSDRPRTAAETARHATEGGSVAAAEASEARAFLRRHRWRLLLLFCGVLLPLCVFAQLGWRVHAAGLFAFDAPLLQFARRIARQGFDAWFVLFSRLGYGWGVVPFDIVLVPALAVLRRYRESVFAAVALGGWTMLHYGANGVLAVAACLPLLWFTFAYGMQTNAPTPSKP